MDRLNEDLHVMCRLCSAKTRLISLFKGKHKENRDYIRKLVLIVTGIKYEENDFFDCICCSCAIQIYNMYVFKSKSLKNQEMLQNLLPKSTKKRCHLKPVSEIELPDYTKLKNKLSSWLTSKNIVSNPSESSLSEKQSNEESFGARSFTSTPIMVDESIQTNDPKLFNMSVQTILKPPVSSTEKESQTDMLVRVNTYTQCDLPKYESRRSLKQNKNVQCELLKSISETQKKYFNKDTYTQCNLIESNKDTTKLLNVYTPTLNFKINSCEKDTRGDDCYNKMPVSGAKKYVHKTLSTMFKAKDIINSKDKPKSMKNNLLNHNITSKNIGEKMESVQNNKVGVELFLQNERNNSVTGMATQKVIEEKLVREARRNHKVIPMKENRDKSSSKRNSQNTSDIDKLFKSDVVTKKSKSPTKHESQKVNKKNSQVQERDNTSQGILQTGKPINTQNKDEDEANKSKGQTKTSSKRNSHVKEIDNASQTDKPITSQNKDENSTKKTKGQSKTPSKRNSQVKENDNLPQTDKPINTLLIQTQSKEKLEFFNGLNVSLKINGPLEVKESLVKPLIIDCQKPSLLPEMKSEPESPKGSFNLDTSLIIKSSPCFNDNSSIIFPSPCSSGLLEVTGKVQYLRSCHECAAVFYTKAEMKDHQKQHMKCYLCRKKFRSVKKTKEHINSNCVRKLCSNNLKVSIVKLEDCRNFKCEYPHIIEQISYRKKRYFPDWEKTESAKKKLNLSDPPIVSSAPK